MVGVTLGWTVYAFARPLLGIYIPGDEEAVSYGISRLFYVSVPYFIFGICNVVTGMLNGLGKTFVPMIITVLNICVFRIVWIYTVWQIPKYHTIQMLFAAYPVSWILTLSFMAVYYLVTVRKLLREENMVIQNG